MTRAPRERWGDAARVRPKDGREIGGDDRIPEGVGFGGKVVEGCRAAVAGVVDEDVESLRSGPRPRRRPSEIEAASVTSQAAAKATGPSAASSPAIRFDRADVAGRQQDPGPLPREAAGDGLADAAGGAGGLERTLPERRRASVIRPAILPLRLPPAASGRSNGVPHYSKGVRRKNAAVFAPVTVAALNAALTVGALNAALTGSSSERSRPQSAQ